MARDLYPYNVGTLPTEVDPQTDIPIWLRPVTDWFRQLSGNLTDEEKRQAEQAKQQTLWDAARQQREIKQGWETAGSNIKTAFERSLQPPDMQQLGSDIMSYDEKLRGMSGKVPFTGVDIPQWLNGIPMAAGLGAVEPALQAVNDLTKKWSEAVTATPLVGTHIRPLDMPYEEYAQSPKSKIGNIPLPWSKEGFDVTTAGLGETLTPDLAIGTPILKIAKPLKLLTAGEIASKLVKVENPIYEVTKLLQGGAARETILEALTTKAKAARTFAPDVAEELVKGAEDIIAKIKGVGEAAKAAEQTATTAPIYDWTKTYFNKRVTPEMRENIAKWVAALPPEMQARLDIKRIIIPEGRVEKYGEMGGGYSGMWHPSERLMRLSKFHGADDFYHELAHSLPEIGDNEKAAESFGREWGAKYRAQQTQAAIAPTETVTQENARVAAAQSEAFRAAHPEINTPDAAAALKRAQTAENLGGQAAGGTTIPPHPVEPPPASGLPPSGGLGGVGQPPVPPAGMVSPAGAIPPVPPAAAGAAPKMITDLQPFQEVMDIAFRPDIVHKIASTKGFGRISKLIGGLAATAETPAEKSVVGLAMLKAEGRTKAEGAVANLMQYGSSKDMFKLNKDGEMLINGANVHLNEIRTYPDKYASALTDVQKQWVKTADEIEKAKLNFLTRNGININELEFEEGGRYAGRRVVGKVDEKTGELLDTAAVGAPPNRVGGKASFEKHRSFKDIKEATDAGYRYMSEEESLYYNTVGAYKRVANKEMADWLLENIPYRTASISNLPKLREAIGTLMRSGKVPASDLKMIAREYPDVSKAIDDAAKLTGQAKATALQDIKNAAYAMQLTTGEKIFLATQYAKRQLELADRVVDVINRVKRGEYPAGATLKSVRRFDADIADKIDDALSITRNELDNVIDRLSLEYWNELKITPQQFRTKIDEVLFQSPDRALKGNIVKGSVITDTVEALAKDQKLSAKMLKQIYENSAQIRKVDKMDILNNLKPRAEKLLAEAKYENAKAANLASQAREKAATLRWGESRIDSPAFAGKILTGEGAKETAEIIKKAMNPEFSDAMHAVNQANSIGRYFVLAGDMSPFMIQLLFMAGRHPKQYGKALGGFVQAFFDPQFLSKYFAKNQDIINKSRGLILSSSGNEFTEAVARGGILRKGVFRIAGKPLEPFQRGFDAAIDVAGIEMRKAYEHLATTPERAADVESFINEFRGLMNTERLGISPKQRQAETLILLAPKYNRAIAAWLFDVFRGGLRGRLARESLAAGLTSTAAMAVAISMARGESFEEIVDHLNPASPNFVTWEIAGQRIGVGSKVRSLLRLGGQLVAYAQEFPDMTDEGFQKKILEYAMGNPALSFIRGNLAPAISTGFDLLTGKDFAGDPTRDNLLQLSNTVLAQNLLPASIQSALLNGGDLSGRVARGAAEFFGWRASPMTSTQQRNKLRDELAQEKGFKDWAEMGTKGTKLVQQMVLDANPMLQELTDKAAADWGMKAEGDSAAWVKYDADVKRANSESDKTIDAAVREFRTTKNGALFREKVSAAQKQRRDLMAHISQNPDYTDIYDFFNRTMTPTEEQKINPKDMARNEYYKMMYAPDMYDEFGNYNFDLAQEKENQFILKYGQDNLDYIDEYTGFKRKGEPPEMEQLNNAKRVLESYWRLDTVMWKAFPEEVKQIADMIAYYENSNNPLAKDLLKKYPQIITIRAKIAAVKKKWLDANPVAKMYKNMFY